MAAVPLRTEVRRAPCRCILLAPPDPSAGSARRTRPRASLGVQLTPDGLIDSVGSPGHTLLRGAVGTGAAASGRSSSGTARPAADSAAEQADLANRAAWTRPGSLRAAFDRTHPRTAALIADLSARAEQFLAGMRMGDGPAEVETFGSALAVVERELAAADRLRREWIAAQGFEVRAGTWEFELGDAVALDAVALDAVALDAGALDAPLPDRLPADTPVASGPAVTLANDYGLLLAVHDPGRSAGAGLTPAGPEGYHRVDELLMRWPRPVTVVVYRRPPSGGDGSVPGEVAGATHDAGRAAAGEWIRDDALTQHVEAVDRHSAVDVLAPQGHPGSQRMMHVSFYPGGSVRTFGVSSASALVGPAVLPADQQLAPGVALPSRSDVAAAALEAARLQLALLQASDEFTRLAATHAHGGELATLEQDARFAALRGRGN